MQAKSKPTDPSFRSGECFYEDSVTQHIADIRLKTGLITSAFGDSQLYFKHERVSNDIALKPEWRRCTERSTSVGQMPSAESIDSWPTDDNEKAKNWLNYSMGDSV